MASEANFTWVDRPDLLNRDQDLSFVYRIRDVERVVIYVGKTRNEPGGRFRQHASPASPSAPWWGDAAAVEVRAVPSTAAAAVEGAEIHQWHPVGNKFCPVCKYCYYPAPRPPGPRPRPASGIIIDTGKLQIAMNRLALSRQDLVQKINAECRHILPRGLSPDALARIGIGKRRPKAATLRALAAALDCEPGSLLSE